MKFILPIVLLGFLTACGQSAEEKQKEKDQESKERLIHGTKHPTPEEMQKRNDTSNYPTNIGHNKTY